MVLSNSYLSRAQLDLVNSLSDINIFLEGPAGCGKTTTAVERLLNMMSLGIRGDQILLFVPQRTLATQYINAMKYPGVVSGGLVDIMTIGGLARRMIDLFWRVISERAGFLKPFEPPIFLTIESAQYYMAYVVEPLLVGGIFNSVVIDRNRIYSQILDNLNKSAIVGFPYQEISERLISAHDGDQNKIKIYNDVQLCAQKYREFCLTNNLLDFSLQVEIFRRYLWQNDLCRNYLIGKYQYLIWDNVEEDIPVAHDIISEWFPEFKSALLIYDWEAGFRQFLGADPMGGYKLKDLCSDHIRFDRSYVSSASIENLRDELNKAIKSKGEPIIKIKKAVVDKDNILISRNKKSTDETKEVVIVQEYHRFFPQMLDWVAHQIDNLINGEGFSPGEIVVMAPFVSDALRFSLMNRLQTRDIPCRSHRPSRSLRDEPVTQCLFTIAMIANSGWGFLPSKFDFTYALLQAIDGIDLVRAQLLSDIGFREKDGLVSLSSFDLITPKMQERITYRVGEKYEELRNWINENQVLDPEYEFEPFDYFLSKLFIEVLSKKGFGFHKNLVAAEIVANVIESVQKFRQATSRVLSNALIPTGKEYLRMVMNGVIAAQYLRSWEDDLEEAVLISPAYTFLMRNRSVDVQFWLDIGSSGWYQRLNQPLTHPYVLNRNWVPGTKWTEEDEYQIGKNNLTILTMGLLRRCNIKVYLGLSDLNEQGFEQRGDLLKAFQRVLRKVRFD